MAQLKDEYFIDFYCKKFGIKPPELVYTSIFNPGAKTLNGLYDKLRRKTKLMGRDEFNLADILDLNRCTVLVDSYEDASAAIKKLKSKIPNLVGNIHNRKHLNGYRGIHLNFYTEEGIPSEIQIATPKTNYIKQLSQAEYNIIRSMSSAEKHQNREQLHHNYELTKQLNLFAFADGAFDKYAPQVEQLLYTYGEIKKPKDIPSNLNKKFVRDEFEETADPEIVKKRLRPVVEFLGKSQQRFIADIGKIVKYHSIGVSFNRPATKLSRLRDSPAALLTTTANIGE
jgi:hypothetical protein